MDDLIERMMASHPPLCSGLIDQGRRIGDDPVGHACSNVASATWWQDGFAWRVCPSCQESLEIGQGRVTLPSWKGQVPNG